MKSFQEFLSEEEKIKEPEFVKVPFKDESEEFKRTAEEFSSSNKEDIEENFNFLKKMYAESDPQSLTNKQWKQMENTDSWTSTSRQKIENAIKANDEPRDIDSVINEFKSGSVRCPIVIEKEDGTYYLVGGNTRLMVARYLKIAPKIIVIKTDW